MMKEREADGANLAGSLLLAHPAMRDPNFHRSVILISAHTNEGALGVVLNRPLGKNLGELREDFAASPLAGIPVYIGGPVNPDQIILAAWQNLPQEGIFKLYFGLDALKVEELLLEEGILIRAFLGYSGWGEGQLEQELEDDSWMATPVPGKLLEAFDGPALWREVLGGLGPEFRIHADEPDDPSRN